MATSITLEPGLACVFERFAEGCDIQGTVDWSDVDLGKVRRAGLLACERAAGQHFADVLRDKPDGFSPEFRELIAWAAGQPVAKIRQADDTLDDVGARLRNDLAETLLIGPTTPCPAPPHGAAIDPDIASLTAPAAIAGVPSLSIPLPVGSGLPIGVQITGCQGNDVLCTGRALFPGKAPVASI